MFIRMTVLVVALSGALGAAQFPAYSQQYMQRLGGAVDALSQVVADFDASAATLGLTRDEALAQMQGTGFVERRRADMQRTFARHAELSADLAALKGHGPFMRAYLSSHLMDADIALGAWEDFRPALPLSFASILFALAGFGVSAVAASALISALRPRKRSAAMPA